MKTSTFVLLLALALGAGCHFKSQPVDRLDHMQKVPSRKLTGFAKHFEGRWNILTMGYTRCPDICPTMMIEFKNIIQKLGFAPSEIQFIFLSMDPEHDSADGLAAYAKHYSDRIKTLRLEPQELADLAGQLGAGFGKVPATGEPFHATQYFVISPEVEWVGYYRSHQVQAGELAGDIKRLQSTIKSM